MTKSVDWFALLERFKPILRYDSFEPYIATSVDALLCIGDADGSSGYCELARAGETVPFASVGRTPAPADVLAVTSAGSYADGRSWGAADQLRVSGRAWGMPDYRYEGALQQERYGSTIYGRVAARPDGWWSQYWLFYFYNDRIDPNAGPLVHEGDWEMVQIRLPPDNADPTRPAPRPDAVTFSQHVTGARRSWWQTRRQDDRLLVYPGRGTHACYPRRTRWGSWALDIRDGGYEVADASLVPPQDESALVQWSGFLGGNPNSPTGLAARTAWRRPELYHEEADGLVRGVVRAAERRARSAMVALGRRLRQAWRKPAVIRDAAKAPASPTESTPSPAPAVRAARVVTRLPWPGSRSRRSVEVNWDPTRRDRAQLTIALNDFGWSLVIAYLIVRIQIPEGSGQRVYTWKVQGGEPGAGFRFNELIPWSLDPAKEHNFEVRAAPATAIGQLRVGTLTLAARHDPIDVE